MHAEKGMYVWDSMVFVLVVVAEGRGEYITMYNRGSLVQNHNISAHDQ